MSVIKEKTDTMDFFTACYRQQGENTASLLLQQYQYKNMQIVFACICTERGNGGRAGEYMTERLLAWFRGINLKRLFRKREKKMDLLLEELAAVVGEIDKELEDGGMAGEGKTGFAGFLCIEDSYIMLCRGETGICLINTAFGRVCLRRLGGKGGGDVLRPGQGSLQPDIGLLLATGSFYEYVTEPMIKEGLFVREISTEKQMEKHLTELGREGERQGGLNLGAILFRSVQ